ncbi:MAG: glycosyltransferase domain-containing protein [Pseudomonadota bacterium]
MGFVKSLRRRAALGRGERFLDAVGIFFASKQRRRSLEFEKYGPNRHALSSPASAIGLTGRSPLADYLDAEWYAETHGLGSLNAANRHLGRHGLEQAYAPCPAMAGRDGVQLAPWAAEFLVRQGVPLGATADAALSPEDPRAIRPFSIRNPARKRIAVVTAVFGGFDRLLPVDPAWTENADFFVFSDRRYAAYFDWQPVHANYANIDKRRSARFVKLHLPTYFSDYEWVMWLDGSVLLCVDPQEVLATLDADALDFATFQHPDRQGLISEAAACLRQKKEEPGVLVEHLSQMQSHAGFRTKQLFETMVMLLRPGSEEVRALCTVWWRMMMRGSKRDQLSLPLAVAETPGLRVGHLPDGMSRSTLFARGEHVKRVKKA